MSEPSVEEIVAMWDHPDGLNLIPAAHMQAIIADWRKRGEALADLRFEKCDCSLTVSHGSHVWLAETKSGVSIDQWQAALTPQQPPPAT